MCNYPEYAKQLLFHLCCFFFLFPPYLLCRRRADSGRLVTNELKHVSRAIAVDNLTAIVSNLFEIRQNLGAIEADTGLLQERARDLQVNKIVPFSVFVDGTKQSPGVSVPPGRLQTERRSVCTHVSLHLRYGASAL